MDWWVLIVGLMVRPHGPCLSNLDWEKKLIKKIAPVSIVVPPHLILNPLPQTPNPNARFNLATERWQLWAEAEDFVIKKSATGPCSCVFVSLCVFGVCLSAGGARRFIKQDKQTNERSNQ